MSKETIIVLALVIAAFFGGFYFSNSKGTTTNTATATPTVALQQNATTESVTIEQVKALFNDKNIVFGDKNSKLLIAEFSDPSCPYCHVAAGKNPTLNKEIGIEFVLKTNGGTYIPPEIEIKKLVDSGKAAYVWLYANGHGNGELATEALYCANEAGKFWQVHDKLMSSEGYKLMNTTIKTDKTQTGVMANFLGSVIDSKTMKNCLDSGKYTNRLSEDMATANQMAFKGTPYFIVGTTRFVGAYNWTEIQPVVDAVLK